MLARLRTRTIGSTLAAIAVAYCLVVQATLAAMLLPGMELAAAGARNLAVICHSDSTSQSSTGERPAGPPNFALHASCAVCVQGHAIPDTAAPRAMVPATTLAYSDYRVTPYLVRFAQRTYEPRSSQGPPQSA